MHGNRFAENITLEALPEITTAISGVAGERGNALDPGKILEWSTSLLTEADHGDAPMGIFLHVVCANLATYTRTVFNDDRRVESPIPIDCGAIDEILKGENFALPALVQNPHGAVTVINVLHDDRDCKWCGTRHSCLPCLLLSLEPFPCCRLENCLWTSSDCFCFLHSALNFLRDISPYGFIRRSQCLEEGEILLLQNPQT